MFKLTRQEQWIVAFVAGAMLLGTVVRHWRAQHEEAARVTTETRVH